MVTALQESSIAKSGPPNSSLDSEVIVDRKSTRLNSSHGYISYAVFCLKKKKTTSTAGSCSPHWRRPANSEIYRFPGHPEPVGRPRNSPPLRPDTTHRLTLTQCCEVPP